MKLLEIIKNKVIRKSMEKTFIYLQNNYGGVGPYNPTQIQTAMNKVKISSKNLDLFITVFNDKDLVRDFGFKLPNKYTFNEIGEGSCGGSYGNDGGDGD